MKTIRNLYPTEGLRSLFVVGWSGAGKASVLATLRDHIGRLQRFMPTIGFFIDSASFSVRGRQRWYRCCRRLTPPATEPFDCIHSSYHLRDYNHWYGMYRSYLNSTVAFVLVVNSSWELDRIARGEPSGMMLDLVWLISKCPHVPIAILANKQDLPDALRPEQLLEIINNDVHAQTLVRRGQIKIFATCAKTGEGVHDAIAWLLEYLDYPSEAQTFAERGKPYSIKH